MTNQVSKQELFDAAIQVLTQDGWTIEKARGGGSVRRIRRGKENHLISIRTTRDRWIAFPRNADDDGWVTLDDVDVVVASSVDDRHEPQNVLVHFLPADEVRKRFDMSLRARKKAGFNVKPGQAMWVKLYGEPEPDRPRQVGAGLGDLFPGTVVPLNPAQSPTLDDDDFDDQDDDAPLTIQDAKRRLAKTLGVPEANIKIIVEG